MRTRTGMLMAAVCLAIVPACALDDGSQDAAPAEDEPALGLAQSAEFDVFCTSHKGHTAGWAECTGAGTVQLVIDCKAPQITDYKSSWVTFSGSIQLSGECAYGINRVFCNIK